MKIIMFLCAVMSVLTGCDTVSSIVASAPMPSLMFSPGYRVQVGERVFPVWGEDSCKDAFSGPDERNCIDLGRDKAQVLVHFKREDGSTAADQWSISRDGGKIAIYTATGEVVHDPVVK